MRVALVITIETYNATIQLFGYETNFTVRICFAAQRLFHLTSIIKSSLNIGTKDLFQLLSYAIQLSFLKTYNFRFEVCAYMTFSTGAFAYFQQLVNLFLLTSTFSVETPSQSRIEKIHSH